MLRILKIPGSTAGKGRCLRLQWDSSFKARSLADSLAIAATDKAEKSPEGANFLEAIVWGERTA
ncbi:hypothetical protein M744_07875 [Synechococcus elongatus UTEX 2973]|nr:hypothetical protein M744_07875 [Synechococcus elongatus UTEX 2973]